MPDWSSLLPSKAEAVSAAPDDDDDCVRIAPDGTPTMAVFFAGALHEGIATALQQSKHVVCFVTGKQASGRARPPMLDRKAHTCVHADEDEESQRWETDYLVDDGVQESLRSEAITLRLVAGSDEAGSLEALFPVPKKPTVVVIKCVPPCCAGRRLLSRGPR